MKNTTPFLQVNSLTKKIEKKNVINNLSFVVQEGSFHGLIGINGAGKTTILKTIVGAYMQYEGEILINGISNKAIGNKKSLGYVPERPVFPKYETVFNYLKYMGTLSGFNLKESKEKVEKLLKEYKIENLAHLNPNKLSSGQKKKIMLLQALINKPSLLILDEPASNLDPFARQDLFSILKKLNSQGVTIIITSHILSELDLLIKDVTVISKGELIFTGSASKFKGNNTLSRAFIQKVGDANA